MYRSWLALVAVAIVGCAGTVVGLGAGKTAVESPATPSARQQAVGSIELVTTIALPGPPTGLAVGHTRVAISVALKGVVLVQRGDARVVRRVTMDGAATAIEADGGRFWVIDLFRDRVLELDEAGTVQSAFRVGPLPGGIAIERSSVWVLSLEEPSITVADRRRELAPVRLLFGAGELWPGAIAAGPHGVWVATEHRHAVILLDPELYISRGRVAIDGVESLAATPNGVWVARRLGVTSELVRIDGSNLERHVVDLPGNGGVTALGAGSLLAVAVRGAILALDPVTGRIRARGVVADGRKLTHVAVDGDDIWAVDAKRNELLRFRVTPPDRSHTRQ